MDTTVEEFLRDYRIAVELGRHGDASEAANHIGHHHRNAGRYRDSLSWFQTDLKHEEQAHRGDRKKAQGRMTTLQCLGDVHSLLGEHIEAHRLYEEQLSIAVQLGAVEEQQKAYTSLAILSLQMYHNDDDLKALLDARHYHDGSLELAQQLMKEEMSAVERSKKKAQEYAVMLANAWNNKGNLQVDTDEFAAAHLSFKEGLKALDEKWLQTNDYEELGWDDEARARLHNSLGQLCQAERMFEEAKRHFVKDKNICEEAKKRFVKDNNICQALGLEEGRAKAWLALGDLHTCLLNFKEAREECKSAMEIADRLEDAHALQELCKDRLEAVEHAEETIKDYDERLQGKLKQLERKAGQTMDGATKDVKGLAELLKEVIKNRITVQQWPKALELTSKYEVVADKLGDAGMKMEAAKQKADTLFYTRNFSRALVAYRSLLITSEEAADLEGQSVARLGIGKSLDAQGDYLTAINEFEQSYRLALEGGERTKHQQVAALRSLSRCYLIRFADLKKALAYNGIMKGLEEADSPDADSPSVGTHAEEGYPGSAPVSQHPTSTPGEEPDSPRPGSTAQAPEEERVCNGDSSSDEVVAFTRQRRRLVQRGGGTGSHRIVRPERQAGRVREVVTSSQPHAVTSELVGRDSARRIGDCTTTDLSPRPSPRKRKHVTEEVKEVPLQNGFASEQFITDRLADGTELPECTLHPCSAQTAEAENQLAVLDECDALLSLELAPSAKGKGVTVSLDLHGNELALETLSKLLKCTRLLPRLGVLNLSRNPELNDAAAATLGEVVSRATGLSFLSLEACNVGPKAVDAICAALPLSSPLKCLSLEGNVAVPEPAVWGLLGKLATLESFQELHIGGLALGSPGAAAVGALLQQSRSLTALHMARSAIADDGAKRLAHALPSARSRLRHLDLSFCSITAAGTGPLCRSFLHLSNLTLLSLQGNVIGNEATEALQEVLASAGSHLASLDVSDCELGCERALLLLKALEGNAHLIELKMARNWLLPGLCTRCQRGGEDSPSACEGSVPGAGQVILLPNAAGFEVPDSEGEEEDEGKAPRATALLPGAPPPYERRKSMCSIVVAPAGPSPRQQRGEGMAAAAAEGSARRGKCDGTKSIPSGGTAGARPTAGAPPSAPPQGGGAALCGCGWEPAQGMALALQRAARLRRLDLGGNGLRPAEAAMLQAAWCAAERHGVIAAGGSQLTI